MSNQEILTPLQKQLMAALFADEWFRRYFYLTGGTALSAFYFGHRHSEDLDFFSHGIELQPAHTLIETVTKKMGLPLKQTLKAPGILRYVVGEDLKIDIVAETDFRIGSPQLMENFMVDSLKNISVNKVCCVLGRLEIKDYVDLYWILKEGGEDIFELITLGRQKDGGLEPFVWASLIGDVKTFSILPRMVKPLKIEDLKNFFLDLRDKILDHIKPKKG